MKFLFFNVMSIWLFFYQSSALAAEECAGSNPPSYCFGNGGSSGAAANPFFHPDQVGNENQNGGSACRTSSGGVCLTDDQIAHRRKECAAYKGTWNDSALECIVNSSELAEESPVQQVQQQNNSETKWGKCEAATAKASEDCRFDGNPETQAAIQMANGLRAQMKAGAMAGGQAALCGQMGNLSQAIDGAVASYNLYCSASYGDCQSVCEEEITEAKAAEARSKIPGNYGTGPSPTEIAEIQKHQRICKSLAGNLKGVKDNVESFAAIEMMKSQYCKAAVDPLVEYCKNNPTQAICKTQNNANCADPAVAATNLTCICARDPMNPQCPNVANSQWTNRKAGTDGTTTGNGDLGDYNGWSVGGGDGIGMEMPQQKGDGGGGGSQNRGGSQRANLDLGNGQGGGKGGSGGGGGYASGLNTKTITGYGFGGSGGGGYGAAARAIQVPNGLNGRNANVRGNGQKVDLRQFMPGGRMDPHRGLAGITGPDGITGPHSNIWKKINIRYFSVKPTLMP